MCRVLDRNSVPETDETRNIFVEQLRNNRPKS